MSIRWPMTESRSSDRTLRRDLQFLVGEPDAASCHPSGKRSARSDRRTFDKKVRDRRHYRGHDRRDWQKEWQSQQVQMHAKGACINEQHIEHNAVQQIDSERAFAQYQRATSAQNAAHGIAMQATQVKKNPKIGNERE